KDLGKSREESWITEIGFVINEIDHTIARLHHWMKPEKVRTNLINLPSGSYVYKEPLGAVLIIGPWNYPLQLLFSPLVGALAAGNCVVLKPSEYAEATAAVMKTIISSAFSTDYVLYTPGDGAVVVPAMMKHFRFDHVFYTGNAFTGRLVYQMAAEKLVPVTLELGGKTPCVIEHDADLTVAARRIAVTKFSNTGQMCVAPDYLLVHESVQQRFMEKLAEVLRKFFTDRAELNPGYGRIINERHFERLISYLECGTIVTGGRYDKETRFLEPTILKDVPENSAVMQEEIFGPILPVFPFSTPESALQLIARNPDPLAFYIFTQNDKKAEWWLRQVPSGGACVNNASWHLTNPDLPFGGRGSSGTGRYHGRYSFETFTHLKAVLKTPAWFDPSLRYPPFQGKLGLFKKLFR
ncbi:MAG TPA: aldehyde dehydrogenase family protein, partial [Chitinophagaceae bacterium]